MRTDSAARGSGPPKAERQEAGLHEGGDRVAKALARAGVASRRDIERLIAEGRVALNGQVLTTPAVKVAPGDLLTVDGKLVEAAEPARLWRYHKPNGLVTSHKDPQNRPTVFQHLPADLPRVISVGRLDLNSEGLLLLTNDGALSRALELPTSGWVRRYRARAFGHVTQDKLDKLKDGITVEGVAYGSIEARLDKVQQKAGEKSGANVWISVAITEGKNREVRRVLEALGLKVNRLIRLAYGPFSLGTLEPGEVEEVGPRVIREQLAQFLTPETMPTGDRPVRAASSAAAPREEAAPVRRGGAKSGPSRNHGDLRSPKAEGRPSKAYPHAGAKGRIESKGPPPRSYGAPAPARTAPARGTYGKPRPEAAPESAATRRENGASPQRPDAPHRFGEPRAPAPRGPGKPSGYGAKGAGVRTGGKPHRDGQRPQARAAGPQGEKAEPKTYKAGWAKPKIKPKPKPGPTKPRGKR